MINFIYFRHVNQVNSYKFRLWNSSYVSNNRDNPVMRFRAREYSCGCIRKAICSGKVGDIELVGGNIIIFQIVC